MRKVFEKLYPYRPNKTYWIHDLSLGVLDSYKVTRKDEGVSNRTINIELNLIRGAIRYAMEANYLIRFPFERFKNLKEEETRKVWCEKVEDVERLIEAAESPSTRLKMQLGFEAGLRHGEILNLKLADIDLSGRLLKIYGEKENRQKEVPMSEEMAESLKALMAYRYDRSGFRLVPRLPHQTTFLFCNDQGKPFTTFGDGFRRAREKAESITRFLSTVCVIRLPPIFSGRGHGGCL
jgi:integrase